MSFSIVHLGHGETAVMEHPDFIDPTVTLPKAPQSPVKRRKLLSEMRVALRALYEPEASLRPSYRKTTLLKARADQCRFITGKLCCGKKVSNPGSSWCQEHRERVFSKPRQLSTPTVNYGHKRHLQSAY